jgi:flagellar motor protein MotB
MPLFDMFQSLWLLRGTSPRALRWFFAALVLCAAGCVPTLRYQEAISMGQEEAEAHRAAEIRAHDTELRLQDSQAKLAALQAELDRRDNKLKEDEQSLTSSKFETGQVAKERDDANDLVNQLRGELARVGGDLRTFADEKQALERALETASARAKELAKAEESAATMVRIGRDLTLAVGDSIAKGELSLDAHGGRVALGIPDTKLFAADDTLTPDAEPMLGAIARVAQQHPETRLEITQPVDDAARLRVRFEALQTALGRRGVAPARIRQMEPAPAAGAQPAASSLGKRSVEFAYVAG